MRDLLLLIILIVMFVFGWIIMRRLDMFISENQSHTMNRSAHKKCEIRVAAPGRRFLSYFNDIIKKYLADNSYLELLYGSASSNEIFDELSEGVADIGLMYADSLGEVPERYDYVVIPSELYRLNHRKKAMIYGQRTVCAVWDKLHESVSRDAVLSALKNEVNTELKGYCDYR